MPVVSNGGERGQIGPAPVGGIVSQSGAGAGTRQWRGLRQRRVDVDTE